MLDDVFGSPPVSPSDPDYHHQETSGIKGIEVHPSDIPRLESVHVTAGYRDGIAVAREKTVQGGFDEGWILGAALGLRAGYVLGVMEGILSAIDADAAIGKKGSVEVRGSKDGKREGGDETVIVRKEREVVGEEVKADSSVKELGGEDGENGRKAGAEENRSSTSAQKEAEQGLSRRAAAASSQMQQELQITSLLSSAYMNEDGTWKWAVEGLDHPDHSRISGLGALQGNERIKIAEQSKGVDTLTALEEHKAQEEVEEVIVGVDQVAAAHPLIRKWSYVTNAWAERLGVHREKIMASLDAKTTKGER